MPIPKFRYTSNTPDGPNKISSTQTPILNNFQAINEFLDANHEPFNSINQGKHKFIIFPFQSGVPVTISGQMSMYAASTSDANNAEIFYTNPTGVVGIPLTGLGESSLPATPGYAYLAGEVLMKWGIATGITTGANTITFPVSGSIPVFTSVSIVQYTPASTYTIPATGSAGPYITNITTTNFVLNCPTTISSSVYWYAIGL